MTKLGEGCAIGYKDAEENVWHLRRRQRMEGEMPKTQTQTG